MKKLTNGAFVCLATLIISVQAVSAAPDNQPVPNVSVVQTLEVQHPQSPAVSTKTASEILRDGFKTSTLPAIRHENNIQAYWGCFAACMVLTMGALIQCKNYCMGGELM